MATHFDYRCPCCQEVRLDIPGRIGHPPSLLCPECEVPMESYFGARKETIINFGERWYHDDIERFRFQNL